MTLSAIVPVDLARRPVDLLRRIQRLLRHARSGQLQIVIGHNDRGLLVDRALKRLCAYYGAQIASAPFYSGAVNMARLRNEAIGLVRTPLTMLLDADVHVETRVLQKVCTAIVSGVHPFQVLPCLYLSRRGSARLVRGGVPPDSLLRDYLRYRRAPFLHMAIPSSVAIFHTRDYLRAGAFDCDFTGHGYEDLDFLLRLAWLYDAIPRSPELLVDAPVRAPLLACGFRGQLARLALPSLLGGQVAFHVWHSTARDGYYESRRSNALRFQEKMRRQVPVSDNVPAPAFDLSLIRTWQDMCLGSNVDVRDYSILFDNRPGHADRLDTPMRRLRFVLGHY